MAEDCRHRMTLRWADFITPSTLQLAPLLELLLVNAVRHGNGSDPRKCLRVRRILTPRWLVFQVQDEGCGVPAHARCGQLPDAPDALCGRGFFLIHSCFDDVRWSARGNRVQVALRR